MDENQRHKILLELCEKLGTTTEHLWSVLVRQAFISGITNVSVCIFWIVFALVTLRMVRRETRMQENDYGMMADCPEFAWVIWVCIVTAIVLIIGCNLEMILASFLNPEYWALKNIIK